MALPPLRLGSYGIMGPLDDNTPLTNILTIAAAAAVGVGAWFLLWRLLDLLPAKLKQRAARDGEMDMLRAGFVTDSARVTTVASKSGMRCSSRRQPNVNGIPATGM